MTAAASAAGARPAMHRQRHPLALALLVAVVALVLLPLATLAGIALSGTGSDWPHLARNVLPTATTTTALLLALTAVGSAVIGVATAWLVVACDFPLRRTVSWMLVLPLAVPPYLAAYAFAEFFLFTGPVQTALRALFGWQTPRDYWFPDIRSTGGAAFVMSCALYPYVYLTCRVVFLMQGRNIADVARTLGAGPMRVLFRVLLPVARPAIAAGVMLVLMETINDIGVAEYLGVRTLTSTVYTTWINRGSLEGAAQIATLMLLLVAALIFVEQRNRGRQRFHATRGTQVKARPPRVALRGIGGWSALLACALPVALGFGVPLYVFGRYASRRLDSLLSSDLAAAVANSIVTATITAMLAVGIALFFVYAARTLPSVATRALIRLGSIGYALPGTILGLGLLFSLAAIDNHVDALARSQFGVSTGLLITGSATAVVLACTIRFLALAEGTIRASLEKLPPHLAEAGRILGATPARSARQILLPLLGPAIGAAAVLVFVDTVKELSATILLRPFAFNTLATLVYENASRGKVEDGAMAALLIIAVAALPIAILSRTLAADRAT